MSDNEKPKTATCKQCGTQASTSMANYCRKCGASLSSDDPVPMPPNVIAIDKGRDPQEVIDGAFAVLKALEGCAWEEHGGGLLILTRCGRNLSGVNKDVHGAFEFCPFCAKRILRG